MKKLIYPLLLVFLITGCSSTKVEHSTSPVYITNTKPVYLLPPEAMAGSVDSLQLLNGAFGDTQFTLFIYFQSDSSGINMTLLNDFGTDMGSLSYDGNSVSFDSAVFPSNLKAEYILCDIQNAYYEASRLTQHYKEAGLMFEEVFDGEVCTRTIKNGKKIVEQITINGNFIKIQNILRGYEYNLTQGEE